MIKKLKNNWVFIIGINKPQYLFYPGWYEFTFGIYKTKCIQGELWGGKEKGIAFSFRFFIPLDF